MASHKLHVGQFYIFTELTETQGVASVSNNFLEPSETEQNRKRYCPSKAFNELRYIHVISQYNTVSIGLLCMFGEQVQLILSKEQERISAALL